MITIIRKSVSLSYTVFVKQILGDETETPAIQPARKPIDLIGCKRSQRIMTGFRVTALAWAFVFIFGLSYSQGSETVVVTKDFNGREIKVRAGSTIQVELEQAGATGYLWEIQALDGEYFEVLSVKTPEPKPTGDIVVGAPVLKTWLIRVKKKGMSELKFIYYRPWEGESKAAEAFVVKVRLL